ncbi:MAG: hypothetical protein ACRBB6_04365 [Neptuniibacter sp.]
MSINNWLEHLEKMTHQAQAAYKKDKTPHACMSLTNDNNPDSEFFDICPDCHHCPFDKNNTDKTLQEIELLKPQLQMINLIED